MTGIRNIGLVRGVMKTRFTVSPVVLELLNKYLQSNGYYYLQGFQHLWTIQAMNSSVKVFQRLYYLEL